MHWGKRGRQGSGDAGTLQDTLRTVAREGVGVGVRRGRLGPLIMLRQALRRRGIPQDCQQLPHPAQRACISEQPPRPQTIKINFHYHMSSPETPATSRLLVRNPPATSVPHPHPTPPGPHPNPTPAMSSAVRCTACLSLTTRCCAPGAATTDATSCAAYTAGSRALGGRRGPSGGASSRRCGGGGCLAAWGRGSVRRGRGPGRCCGRRTYTGMRCRISLRWVACCGNERGKEGVRGGGGPVAAVGVPAAVGVAGGGTLSTAPPCSLSLHNGHYCFPHFKPDP